MNTTVPKEWIRIADPELIWLAMIAAKKGQTLKMPGFEWGPIWESGAVDSFGQRDDRMCVTQKSLAGYVDGRRFVVVWCPQEPTSVPEVYHDPRWRPPSATKKG